VVEEGRGGGGGGGGGKQTNNPPPPKPTPPLTDQALRRGKAPLRLEPALPPLQPLRPRGVPEDEGGA
jgi:hypothetical protein